MTRRPCQFQKKSLHENLRRLIESESQFLQWQRRCCCRRRATLPMWAAPPRRVCAFESISLSSRKRQKRPKASQKSFCRGIFIGPGRAVITAITAAQSRFSGIRNPSRTQHRYTPDTPAHPLSLFGYPSDIRVAPQRCTANLLVVNNNDTRNRNGL